MSAGSCVPRDEFASGRRCYENGICARRAGGHFACGATGLTLGMAFANGGDGAVKIDNFTFMPKILTVKVGTTVIWTNQDDIPHTVASTTQQFRSKALDTDDKFSFTFSRPGHTIIFAPYIRI
jgi:plastocyanin